GLYFSEEYSGKQIDSSFFSTDTRKRFWSINSSLLKPLVFNYAQVNPELKKYLISTEHIYDKLYEFKGPAADTYDRKLSNRITELHRLSIGTEKTDVRDSATVLLDALSESEKYQNIKHKIEKMRPVLFTLNSVYEGPDYYLIYYNVSFLAPRD